MKDIEPRVPLEHIDPGHADPGYWARFHGRVMNAVADELSRRRRTAITLGEAVLSWGRLVLPAAAVATVAASLLILDPSVEAGPGAVAGLEEFLSLLVDGEEPLPAFLYSDEVVDRDLVLYAVEGR